MRFVVLVVLRAALVRLRVAAPLLAAFFAEPVRRRVVAAFLSSFVPGVGQLYIGELRKGTGLLLAFAALLACVWGFRMLRLFEGFLFTVVTWLILTGYASCAALLKPISP